MIVLMTDFGLQDSYVGVMKGVIGRIAPTCTVIDLTHAIRTQDVAHGAYTLQTAIPYFAAETIFVAVVDPGVGSSRYAIAAQIGEWTFVAPDNGLLTGLLASYHTHTVVTLDNPMYHLPTPSKTFHGRDIFAPVAAHLASGVTLSQLGEPFDAVQLHRLPLPTVTATEDGVQGSIIHIDRFGNIVTTLRREDLQESANWKIHLAGVVLEGIYTAYAAVAVGTPIAYFGSDGFLELAIRNGNAAATWGVQMRDSVKLVQR